jgi:UDP-N-acetylmuramoyl-L-alanyl-D-glutamate--2,6-diaminopimelate ligase
MPKLAVVNGDDPEAEFFLEGFSGQKIITSIAAAAPNAAASGDLAKAVDIKPANDGSTFRVGQDIFTINLPGGYNVANALQAVAVAKGLGLAVADIQAGLAEVKEIPGRFNKIAAGNNRSVVIDYAVTPAAMRALLENLRQRGAHKIISVFGATGGGRDKWKRPELGKTAAAFADHIILTTEDPFDENPAAIANAILAGVPSDDQGHVETVLDRRAAIKRALAIAQPGDVIALTGMGSETTMNVAGGKKIAWNDKLVVESLLS